MRWPWFTAGLIWCEHICSALPAGNSWKAEGMLFHMSGHWELYVDITQGGATERAQMDVDLK